MVTSTSHGGGEKIFFPLNVEGKKEKCLGMKLRLPLLERRKGGESTNNP